MIDPNAEMDELAAMLKRAGFVETHTRPDGRVNVALNEKGGQLARAMETADEDADAVAMLDALLDASEEIGPSGS